MLWAMQLLSTSRARHKKAALQERTRGMVRSQKVMAQVPKILVFKVRNWKTVADKN